MAILGIKTGSFLDLSACSSNVARCSASVLIRQVSVTYVHTLSSRSFAILDAQRFTAGYNTVTQPDNLRSKSTKEEYKQ
jgi:hypothetical protein